MAFDYDRDNVARASSGPSDDCFPITPGAGLLASPVRSIGVAVGGDVTGVTLAGQTRTITVPAGMVPCGWLRITAATATGIVGYI